MTVEAKTILRWMLAGATFLAVMGLAGCSVFEPKQPVAKAPALAAAPATQPAVAALPPSVDPFGKLGASNSEGPSVGATNLQEQTFAAVGGDRDVCVDPSGKWIAFTSTRNSEHANIYVQRVDGTSVVQLTDDSADDAFPSFSPDGKSIAFSSNRGGAWSVYTMDFDGRNVVQVTNGPGQAVHPSFSPDGRQLVYSSQNPRSGQWELWTVSLDSNQKRMIGYGLFPSWSPDKQVNRIAFQRARQRGSHLFELWTLELLNGEATRVTQVAESPVAAILSPSWSPDGKKLAFATVAESGSVQGTRDIWVVDANGGQVRRLTEGGASNVQPYWAVDNRIYFVSNRNGTDAIWSIDAGWDNKQQPAASAEAAPVKPTATADAAPPKEAAPSADAAPVKPAAKGAKVGSADTSEVTP